MLLHKITDKMFRVSEEDYQNIWNLSDNFEHDDKYSDVKVYEDGDDTENLSE